MSTDGAGDAPHPLVITMWETYGSNMEAVAVRVGEILSVPIHMQAYSSEDIERAQEERENEGALGRLVRLLAPVGSIQDVAWNPSAWMPPTARWPGRTPPSCGRRRRPAAS